MMSSRHGGRNRNLSAYIFDCRLRQKEWAGSGIRLLISEPTPSDGTSSRKTVASKHSQTVPQLGNQGFES